MNEEKLARKNIQATMSFTTGKLVLCWILQKIELEDILERAMKVGTTDFFSQWLNLQEIGSFEDIQNQLKALSEENLSDLMFSSHEHFMGELTSERSTYQFIADTRLSGLPIYCFSDMCRFKMLFALARFAVLYADKVYVVSPFSYALEYVGRDGSFKKSFYEHLAFAVFAMLSLRPLIEANLISFVPFRPERICSECMLKLFSNSTSSDTFTSLIFDHLYETTKCSYIGPTNARTVQIEYDDTHDEHLTIRQGLELPAQEAPLGHILTKRELIQHGIFQPQIRTLSHDFMLKNIVADKTGAQQVFGNSTDFELINQFTDRNTKKRSATLTYPTLTSVTLSQALKIREEEWHHISDFRSALNELKSAPDLSAESISEAADAELSKIYKIIAKSRREATRDLVDSIPLGGFSIVAAIATSGLSSWFSAATGVLGGGHLFQKAVPATRKLVDIPEEARESRYFYAWKVSKYLDRVH